MDGTGIVWLTTPDGNAKGNVQPGALHAFDATDLSHELFKGSCAQFVKFTVPPVANGNVFVGTGNSLDVYGLA